jgi:hypothetical protein
MQLGRIQRWFDRSRRYGKFSLGEFAAKYRRREPCGLRNGEHMISL